MKFVLILMLLLPMGVFAQNTKPATMMRAMTKTAAKPAIGKSKFKGVQKKEDKPCRLPNTKSKIKWFTGDFEAAVKKAKKENKKIYAFFTCDG